MATGHAEREQGRQCEQASPQAPIGLPLPTPDGRRAERIPSKRPGRRDGLRPPRRREGPAGAEPERVGEAGPPVWSRAHADPAAPAACGDGPAGRPACGAQKCRSGGPGASPRPEVFVKRKHIWLLNKPEKPTPPWRASRENRPGRQLWTTRQPCARFQTRRSCSPSREESNDGTHETKPPELRRRRMGPEPGPGLSRSEDRPIPARVAENGRRLTRSLKHRDWRRAKRQADKAAAGFAVHEPNGHARGRAQTAHAGHAV